MGAVLLWGRVAHAEVVERYSHQFTGSDLGLRLRAQFGRLLALRDDGELTGPACRVHGIPAVHERYLESLAREHGVQLRIRRPARDRGGAGSSLRRLEKGLIRSYLDGTLGG